MSRERRISEQELVNMEDYLSTLLSPVPPRAGFVRELRQGLGQADTSLNQKGNFGFVQKIFWIGAGFTSAIVLLTVGIRVIVNLVRGSNLRGRGRRRGIVSLP